MVLDEPRPCANGSYASPTSVCIISFTSSASLPSVPVTRPRKQPTSAIVSRSVCQAIAGCARPSSFINPAWVSSPPWPREASVAVAPGLRAQLAQVDSLEPAVAHDLRGRRCGDDAEPGLDARQSGLDVEIFARAVLVGPDLAHGLGAEEVAEDDGVDAGCGHVLRLLFQEGLVRRGPSHPWRASLHGRGPISDVSSRRAAAPRTPRTHRSRRPGAARGARTSR